MSGAKPPELPAAAPRPYEDPSIVRDSAVAVGFSLMSLVAGLGWGVAVPGVCGIVCVATDVSRTQFAAVVIAACALIGFGLFRTTTRMVRHERIALLCGYAIAAGLTSPFIIRVFSS